MADELSDACSRTDGDGVRASRNNKRKSSQACSYPNKADRERYVEANAPSDGYSSDESSDGYSSDEMDQMFRITELHMRENVRLQSKMNRIMQDYLDKNYPGKVEKIRYVQQLARESGANERNAKLWLGVQKITMDYRIMELFILTTPEGRMHLIQFYAEEANAPRHGDTSDDVFDDEELYIFFLEDDDSELFMHITLQYAMHLDKYYNKAEHRQPFISMIDKYFMERNRIQSMRNQMLQNHLEKKLQAIQQKQNAKVEKICIQQKQNAKVEKIRHVQQLAREWGERKKHDAVAWCVLKIAKDDNAMKFFIETKPESRMQLIQFYAAVNN